MIKENYIPTGNEMISLSDIREKDAAIMGVTFLHMGYRGLVEIRGKDSSNPLLEPFVIIDNNEKRMSNIVWERLDYWIPRFVCNLDELEMQGTILAPIGERGFIYSIKIRNSGHEDKKVTVGMKGNWGKTIHEINESKEINANKYIYRSGWNSSIVFDLKNDISIFSFAPIFEESMNVSYNVNEENKEISFVIDKSVDLHAGEEHTFNYYWGFGFEEVGSTTSAKEMLRKGYEKELESTRKWLFKRINYTDDKRLDRILNTNLFFNFFFASGITLDTEEFVLVTSRSPRYYVSAAYWDRDSLLWSLPSILLVDAEYARDMLDYVFTKQIRNIGIHSRYIDGTVLEPGFELDELCAPILALYSYIKKTGNYEIVKVSHFERGINKILKILDTKKHSSTYLYETFLQPTDDMIVYPYLTYDNVLVWKALKNLTEVYMNIGENALASQLLARSKSIEKAIWDNCVVEYNEKKIFAWSLDLDGKWNVYDEPPGSIQLLPYFGFCGYDNQVYKNTVEEIRKPEYPYSFSGCNIAEIGCEHAPHPWILSVANSLLCGRKEHCKDILLKIEMDNGIACESVDENTGKCMTGEAFATCAGFLAYAINYAFGDKKK